MGDAKDAVFSTFFEKGRGFATFLKKSGAKNFLKSKFFDIAKLIKCSVKALSGEFPRNKPDDAFAALRV